MAQLTQAEFFAKWVPLLADNVFQDIDGARFEALLGDLRDSAVWANQPNVDAYDPKRVYPVGEVVRFAAGGREAFYYSRKAGLLPAPSGQSDDNWRLVPGPVAELVLSQLITLAEAQGAWAASVTAGRRYAVVGKWNGSAEDQVVYLDGLENYFRQRGTLLDPDTGAQQEVDVDVLAGTYVAAASGGGGTGDVTQQQLADGLATKADLVAGKVPLSQTQQQYKWLYDYAAGQTTQPEKRMIFPGSAGFYAVEQASDATGLEFYLNDMQVAPDAQGRFTLAYLDRFAIKATSPAGQAGYVILSQVL